MPELPDVAGFKQTIDANALHKKILKTEVLDRRLLFDATPQRLAARVTGAEFAGSTRHGKYLFLDISKGGCLVLHFAMTGQPEVGKFEDGLPEYTRVAFHFPAGWSLAIVSRRMLGKVGWVEDMESFLDEQGQGPDALSDRLTKERFVRMVRSKDKMAKSALMDQSFIAGIGNVWADEILLQAGIHPQTPLSNLADTQIDALYTTMRRTLQAGARHGGDVGSMKGRQLIGRRGPDGNCPRCGGNLKETKVNNRTTWFCPACQEAT